MGHARNYIDLTGRRFGRVTALAFSGTTEAGNSIWKVRCDCGVEFLALGSNLRTGRTKSCGCYRSEKTRETNIKRFRHNDRV